MTWRDAKAIDVLQKQVNDIAPNRSKVSDGTIGDESHQSRSSDHNPWVRGRDGQWVVTGVDITHDPANAMDCNLLAMQLKASKDRRIKYVIWNHQIMAGADGPNPWQWRAYYGKNSHTHHLHLSVENDDNLFDDESPWLIEKQFVPTHVSQRPIMPKLKNGATGDFVKKLQEALRERGHKLEPDGDFGPKTDRAVRIFQKENGLVADGVVGPYTWEKLGL